MVSEVVDPGSAKDMIDAFFVFVLLSEDFEGGLGMVVEGSIV